MAADVVTVRVCGYECEWRGTIDAEHAAPDGPLADALALEYYAHLKELHDWPKIRPPAQNKRFVKLGKSYDS